MENDCAEAFPSASVVASPVSPPPPPSVPSVPPVAVVVDSVLPVLSPDIVLSSYLKIKQNTINQGEKPQF